MQPSTEALPAGALTRLGSRKFASGYGLHSLAWSADGARLAATTGRGVALFDARDGRPIFSVVADANPSGALHPFAVAFADGGAALVTLGRDGWLRRWSAETGEALSARALDVFTGRFSPDGTTLLCVPRDSATRVLLDARTGETLRALDGEVRGGQHTAAWSADGARVATAVRLSSDVALWDARTGARLGVFHSEEFRLDAIALSPDGRLVAAGGNDGVARVWRDDGARVLDAPALRHSAYAPCSVALGAGGAFARAAGGVIERLDLASGAAAARVEPGGDVFDLAYAPDGGQLAFRSAHVIRRIACRTNTEVDDGPRMRAPVAAAGITPDGARAVLLGAEPRAARPEAEVRVWSLGDGSVVGGSDFSHGAADVAPDGSFVASVSDGALVLRAPLGGLLHRWSGAVVTEGPVVERDGRAVRFTHTQAGNVCRFERSSATVELIGARTERSPDGALRLAHYPGDKTAWRVLDEASGALVAKLAAAAQRAFFVAWRGASLVALGPDGALRTCEARAGKAGKAIKLIPEEIREFTTMRCAALTPDGRWLAAGDDAGRVVVVDLDAGAVRAVLEGHEGPVLCVRPSADGKTLLSGGADTTAVLWAMPEPAPAKPKRKKSSESAYAKTSRRVRGGI